MLGMVVTLFLVIDTLLEHMDQFEWYVWLYGLFPCSYFRLLVTPYIMYTTSGRMLGIRYCTPCIIFEEVHASPREHFWGHFESSSKSAYVKHNMGCVHSCLDTLRGLMLWRCS